MQEEAVPFDMSPRSFGLVVILLMVIVYATQFVIRLVIQPASWLSRWPFLRRTITSWIKIAKLERDYKPLESGFQDGFAPTTGVYADRIMSDEKTNEIGTSALLGDQRSIFCETRPVAVRQVQWDV
jgi:hypothetical protein